MKPPSTPSAPFIPGVNGQNDSPPTPQASPEPARSVLDNCRMKVENSPSPINNACEVGWRLRPFLDDNIPPTSPCTKRRRREINEIYPPVRENSGPENPYLPRTLTLPRPELLLPVTSPHSIWPVNSPNYIWNIQSHHQNSAPPSPHDPSLVLPPLQLAPQSYPQTRGVEETPLTISFLKKISLLSKGSPPFTTSSSPDSGHAGGSVIAIEGDDPELIAYVTEYLNNALSCDDGGNVRIFKGPEASTQTASEDTRAAAGNHLETIFSWYKISGRIIEFLNDRFSPAVQPSSCEDESKSNASFQSIIPKTEYLRISSPGRSPSGEAAYTPASSDAVYTPASSEAVYTPTSSSSDSAFRIALVPQYQLATTEAHACLASNNGTQDPMDHWERMAMQWGSCVGPDITVYIRDCDQDEMSRYGEGNSVENRLNDVRTLVIRRLVGSNEGIDERALRRVGFEVKEFLRK
ncbi:HMG-box transcription factor [Arthroderma uncinatum]|uniref:HMG-box transcription factor n=1 Tax=Arthroderma uncinatum TaxID=74035 RepID=UPI00144AC016|nr:HMG-box transcription factor [Arthroderma uncinatum]KAF3481345.1 HMG-box transcription factor [Arthroderma uncinatum]